MKKTAAVILILVMLASGTCTGFASAVEWNQPEHVRMEAAIQDTAEYLMKTNPAPEIGSVGGEWTILALLASGAEVPSAYYDGYYQRVVQTIQEKQGILTQNKYTEYSRLILALTALGKDVTKVGGYNLLEKLADFDLLKKQGVNGPVYALLALDSHGYEIPAVKPGGTQTTRQGMLDYILAQEVTDANGVLGGFNLGGGNLPDADVTGMVLQALAKYVDQPKVKTAVDRGLAALRKLENPDGSYASWGTETSESIVQVIVAKTALGTLPDKNMEALMEYYLEGEGFEHVRGQGSNTLATEQGLYALASYKLRVLENRSLHDYEHVKISMGPVGIRVFLNGSQLMFDQPPINLNSRVLVPMRVIFEALGAQVYWEESSRTVTGILEGKTITLKIGSKEATINGVQTTLDVPAQIMNGRTLVPVRFISESLGASVEWSQQEQKVTIETL